MTTSSKRPFLLSILLLFVFPVIFLLVFMRLHKDAPKLDTQHVLPIYGPRTPFENENSKGRKFTDTAYFHIPDFKFVNQLGDTITKNSLNGKILLVDFFFTTCKTICIDMHRNMKKVQEEFNDEPDVQILSHTVDPETDSVKQLFQYAVDNNISSKNWFLLTGDKKEIYKMARNGYFITATQGDGGPADFIHDEKIAIIDKEGQIRGFYNGTDSLKVKQLMDAVKVLLASYNVPMKVKTK
jgi:protein SCO1/2